MMAEMMRDKSRFVQGEVSGARGQCQACKLDGNIHPAVGWCETCDELLCDHCYNVHRKPTATRHHQLWSISEMGARKQRKMGTNKCETHPDKMLKYFCEVDSELCCSKCLKANHRMCDNMVCIADVVTTKTEEFRALESELSKLEEKLKTSEEQVAQNTTIATRLHKKIVTDIQGAGVRLKSLIDKLVEKQISVAEKLHEENMRTILDIEMENKDVAEKLEEGRTMLAEGKGDNMQLFITMKHLQDGTKLLDSQLDYIGKKNKVKEHAFELNAKLADVLMTVEQLGMLEDQQVLDIERSTDEVVDIVRRFTGTVQYSSNLLGDHKIGVSTSRDIRLMSVFLYGDLYNDTDVRIKVSEGSKCLMACGSTHPSTRNNEFAVSVKDGDVRGVSLLAGHQYVITAMVLGRGRSFYTDYFNDISFDCQGRCQVTEGGVTFTFSKAQIDRGQIPGLGFIVL